MNQDHLIKVYQGQASYYVCSCGYESAELMNTKFHGDNNSSNYICSSCGYFTDNFFTKCPVCTQRSSSKLVEEGYAFEQEFLHALSCSNERFTWNLNSWKSGPDHDSYHSSTLKMKKGQRVVLEVTCADKKLELSRRKAFYQGLRFLNTGARSDSYGVNSVGYTSRGSSPSPQPMTPVAQTVVIEKAKVAGEVDIMEHIVHQYLDRISSKKEEAGKKKVEEPIEEEVIKDAPKSLPESSSEFQVRLPGKASESFKTKEELINYILTN